MPATDLVDRLVEGLKDWWGEMLAKPGQNSAVHCGKRPKTGVLPGLPSI